MLAWTVAYVGFTCIKTYMRAYYWQSFREMCNKEGRFSISVYKSQEQLARSSHDFISLCSIYYMVGWYKYAVVNCTNECNWSYSISIT